MEVIKKHEQPCFGSNCFSRSEVQRGDRGGVTLAAVVAPVQQDLARERDRAAGHCRRGSEDRPTWSSGNPSTYPRILVVSAKARSRPGFHPFKVDCSGDPLPAGRTRLAHPAPPHPRPGDAELSAAACRRNCGSRTTSCAAWLTSTTSP